MDDLSSRRRRFRRRLLSSKGEEDYLSNLPDELLTHILSFLPTLDSIRTSVLARRWRHVWTSVPVIDFSYLQLKSTMIKRFFASRGDKSASRLRLSGLSNFDLGIKYICPSFNCDFDCESCMSRDILVCTMVDYAKSHDARHVTLLRLFFQYLSDCFYDQLFDWPSLESLDLEVVGCKNGTLFNFSKSVISLRLSNLKTLSLSLGQNGIHDESLAKLLSACPVLEELTLSAKYFRAAHRPIRIEAPNLLRLTLIPTPSKLQINCQKLEYLMLKPEVNLTHLRVEAPSLISVRLYNIWRFGTFAQTLCDVTTAAITLSDKCLSDSTPRFLEKYKAVVQGFPIFHKLLELRIKMYVAEKFSLDIVFDLLRCTPNLQSLVLTECEKRPCDDEDFDEWEKNFSSRINEPLEHLERVSVNIKSERIRSAFLNTLSDRVPAWDRVAVTC
ncbi:hypothetical protein ZIOFF_031069 [Zingiber officinale]|uniref:F-box domain-containing protein n=3 Tax=Zingiber officinale TaxID=94328 RepID=A0A8J5GS82_ZINOF|nr:hypothetical protein ZIOFF_031069 [Zingiber officinale]